MPRPPRAKVASRVAKPPTAKATATRSTRAQAIAAASTTLGEESDGLTTRSSRRTNANTHAQPDDFTMTGALPAGENASPPPARARTPASAASRRAHALPGSAERSPAGDVSIEDSSGFGDLTFSSLGSDSPAHGTRPPSAIKVGATPAQERSILALTNFRRRARQPSLLRMVQPTTDVEDNDHSDLDNTDNFDFDDFLPHAESTPLHVRKSGPSGQGRTDSGTQISSSGSRGTKRKLSPVVQVPRSSPPGSPSRNSDGDLESEQWPSPSLPDVVSPVAEVIAQTQEGEELLSQTYAPPMSSSSLSEEPAPPESPTQTRPRRRGRPATTPLRDDDDEEGDETETPAQARRGARKKAQQALSTVQLKGLLPRRRNRLRDRDEFELESSEEVTQLDSDQDELQAPARRIYHRPGAQSTSPKASKKGARGKKAGPRPSKTYSRRRVSDKENDGANQEAAATKVSALEHSEKLAAIRKKFEEVDAFELDFETVDATTSSSPFG